MVHIKIANDTMYLNHISEYQYKIDKQFTTNWRCNKAQNVDCIKNQTFTIDYRLLYIRIVYALTIVIVCNISFTNTTI